MQAPRARQEPHRAAARSPRQPRTARSLWLEVRVVCGELLAILASSNLKRISDVALGGSAVRGGLSEIVARY